MSVHMANPQAPRENMARVPGGALRHSYFGSYSLLSVQLPFTGSRPYFVTSRVLK